MNQSTKMRELIARVRGRVSFGPCAPADAAIAKYAAAFDASVDRQTRAALNIFVFHVDVPSSHRTIEYVDVKHDHWQFDYKALTAHFVWAALAFHKNVRIYYVTHEAANVPFQHPNLTIVRLPTDNTAPMYERVRAMAGYVHSDAFAADTVFLDSDAYPNRALNGVFKRDFDIGVTYRTTPGYMPVNEGVIFCARRRLADVRRFFTAYLSTYEVLKTDAMVREYYGNIERWRGGQLSLNAVSLPADLSRAEGHELAGTRIALLPCNKYNYWVTKAIPPERPTWDSKFVLHLKGDSKHLLGHVVNYQLGQRLPASAVAPGKWRELDSQVA
jgi:hypothetical protein